MAYAGRARREDAIEIRACEARLSRPIDADDLAVETARRFGFDRTGQDLKQEIDRQVKALLRVGKIVQDGNVIHSPAAGN